MKYVMSDIHGEYNKFLGMLDRIEFNDNDTLYILGDIIDRGGKSIEMIEYVMSKPNIKMVLGNHEDMMLDWYVDHDHNMFDMWIYNGGHKTWYDFEGLHPQKQDIIIKWMSRLPLYYIVDDKFFLCHAGYHEEYKNTHKTRNTILWAREEFYNNPADTGYTVVFGHTPTRYINGTNKIWKKDNKIDIDCGIIHPLGKLACLRLDDMEEFYV